MRLILMLLVLFPSMALATPLLNEIKAFSCFFQATSTVLNEDAPLLTSAIQTITIDNIDYKKLKARHISGSGIKALTILPSAKMINLISITQEDSSSITIYNKKGLAGYLSVSSHHYFPNSPDIVASSQSYGWCSQKQN